LARTGPPATDVLLHLNVPYSGGGAPAYLEIDKLPDGRHRATVGACDCFLFAEILEIDKHYLRFE
jgi:hypothetical protein